MENDLKVHYLKTVVPAMMKNRGYTNLHQVPKLEKIVLNCSVGSLTDIKVALEDAVHDLTMITGQKPIKTKSKKSISNFNLRLHQEIGCKVTLRGKIMYDFLLRFIRAALPRIRDFRGIPNGGFDGRGAYTLGVKDHSIFPEIEIDRVKRNLGFDVTFVTSGKEREETREMLSLMGMPFIVRTQDAAKTGNKEKTDGQEVLAA
ncbi:RplE Ribosomal protein L5 [Candidatus Methylacidiphilaceae bacterium]|jgi:large subunit ribosomal protein L5|nr:50S ribosomal protein L5 [Candidatus Paceibacterota bacterium]